MPPGVRGANGLRRMPVALDARRAVFVHAVPGRDTSSALPLRQIRTGDGPSGASTGSPKGSGEDGARAGGLLA